MTIDALFLAGSQGLEGRWESINPRDIKLHDIVRIVHRAKSEKSEGVVIEKAGNRIKVQTNERDPKAGVHQKDARRVHDIGIWNIDSSEILRS